MLYQEQTMKACHEVFGMTLDDAETLRRDIGKKKVEEIPKWQNRIFQAAEKNGVSEEAAQYFGTLLKLALLISLTCLTVFVTELWPLKQFG